MEEETHEADEYAVGDDDEEEEYAEDVDGLMVSCGEHSCFSRMMVL